MKQKLDKELQLIRMKVCQPTQHLFCLSVDHNKWIYLHYLKEFAQEEHKVAFLRV